MDWDWVLFVCYWWYGRRKSQTGIGRKWVDGWRRWEACEWVVAMRRKFVRDFFLPDFLGGCQNFFSWLGDFFFTTKDTKITKGFGGLRFVDAGGGRGG